MTTSLRFFKNMTLLFPETCPDVVVACSGGVDSMVLLDLLRRYRIGYRKKKKANFKIVVCHVDHGQRADSHLDAELIRSYCKKHRLIFKTRQLNLNPGANENDLRDARYAALKKMARGRVVLTAHHAQDNLETFLFKLIRGSHPLSLRGIYARSKRNKMSLARPLLDFAKPDLILYAEKNKVDWREDLTNSSLRFARNRIRMQLVPLLEELRPGASKRMLEFFTALQQIGFEANIVNDQKSQEISAALASPQGVEVKAVGFQSLKQAVDVLLGSQSQKTTKAHWLGIEALLSARQKTKRGGGPAKRIELPGGKSLRFEGSRLYWEVIR